MDALGALKSKVAVPGLIQALDDENARVRRAAHKTLMNLTRRTIIIDPDAPCQDHLGLKTQWEVWWKTAEATLQIDQEGS